MQNRLKNLCFKNNSVKVPDIWHRSTLRMSPNKTCSRTSRTSGNFRNERTEYPTLPLEESDSQGSKGDLSYYRREIAKLKNLNQRYNYLYLVVLITNYNPLKINCPETVIGKYAR